MLIEREGQLVEVDPAQVAVEQSIVCALKRHGPTRNKDLWYRTSGQYHGRALFNAALDSLVERRVIVREATKRVNAFIYRLRPASDAVSEHRVHYLNLSKEQLGEI